MRKAFINTLTELAENQPNIVLLCGDLGYGILDAFADRFPSRFFNAGVAEQNMVGMATGLAEAGFIPFTYSIVPFASLRPYEFIRNGPIHHRLPVRIVGTGGGFEYGYNGMTHFGLEDIGIMRIQPGITVVVPADHQQARNALLATWNLETPIYYRIGKDDQSIVPGLDGRFDLNHVQQISEGDDFLIITTGSVANEVAAAAAALAAQNIFCSALVVSTLNPPPLKDLAESLSKFGRAMTVEAHYIAGGLGSLVSEIAAELAIKCQVIRCGVTGTPDGFSGSQDYHHRRHGLCSKMLIARILELLN